MCWYTKWKLSPYKATVYKMISVQLGFICFFYNYWQMIHVYVKYALRNAAFQIMKNVNTLQ